MKSVVGLFLAVSIVVAGSSLAIADSPGAYAATPNVSHQTDDGQTLRLPAGSVVTFESPRYAQTRLNGSTIRFSRNDYSTITSSGSSTIVIGSGVDLNAAASAAGVTISGMLFDQSFSSLHGNGSSTSVSLSGTNSFDALTPAGSATFGSLNLSAVTGTITGTNSMVAHLPSAGTAQVTIANSSVTVTIGSTPITFASFGGYAAQGSATTSFTTDDSIGLSLIGNGNPSSLTIAGSRQGTISYTSASAGSASRSIGSSTVTTTFSNMGHIASSWPVKVPIPVPTTTTTTIPQTPPSTPSPIIATIPSNAIDRAALTWSAPRDSGSPITSYTVTPFDETTGRANASVQVSGTTSSTIVAGLKAGDVYSFTLRATNAIGTSGVSGASNTVVPIAAIPQKQTTGSSASPSGVASTSVTSSGSSHVSVAVHARGQGSATAAFYRSSPLSSSGTRIIARSGNVVTSYFDVSIASSSHFASVAIAVCAMEPGQELMWWDPVHQALVRVSRQTAMSGPNLCVTATITNRTSPNISELYGTIFAIATPKSYALATSPGSFWVLSFNGQVKNYGKAKAYGSVAWRTAGLLEPFVAISPSMDAKGYVVVSRSGTVLPFGDAKSYGSISELHLKNASQIQIIAITRTVDGKGYWLTATNGSVYAFGDAKFYGSAASVLRAHHGTVISGVARTHDGKGYWLVTNNGKVFPFGDAGHYGSATNANAISGMASAQNSKGYWLVNQHGAVYAFGDVHNYGSLSHKNLSAAIIGITSTTDGKGYYLINETGAVSPFGDAQVKKSNSPPPRIVTASAITIP